MIDYHYRWYRLVTRNQSLVRDTLIEGSRNAMITYSTFADPPPELTHVWVESEIALVLM